MRDNQRERVYSAERNFSGPLMKPVAARRLVRETCKLLQVTPPKVEVRKGGIRSLYHPGRLRMLPTGNNLIAQDALLHELAHHIVHERYGPGLGHGPHFARIVGSLYTLFRITHNAFKEFKAHKVEF